jgi:hypothetical protein
VPLRKKKQKDKKKKRIKTPKGKAHADYAVKTPPNASVREDGE